MWRMPADTASLGAGLNTGISFRPLSLFLDRRRPAPLLPLRAGGANLSRTVATAIGGKQNVSWTGRGHGPRCAGQALRAALRRLYAGDAPLDWFGLGRGPSLVCGRPLSHLVGHSQQPDAALRRGIGSGVRLPAGLQQFERQHRRQPGPARHLRASDAPRDPHRVRRLDQGARRQVGGQAFQLAERRRREIGRLDLVHRPGLRHRRRQRGRAGDTRNRWLLCLSYRQDRRDHETDRQHGAAERHRLLPRREDDLCRRYRRDAQSKDPTRDPPLRHRRGWQEREGLWRNFLRIGRGGRTVRRLSRRPVRTDLDEHRQGRLLLRTGWEADRQDPHPRDRRQRDVRRSEAQPPLHLRHDIALFSPLDDQWVEARLNRPQALFERLKGGTGHTVRLDPVRIGTRGDDCAMELGLKGKVVLVTGGSKGIGLACAAGFAAEGARVAICSRSRENIDKASAELNGAFGVVADLVDAVAAERMVDTVEDRLGPIDILVNSAGAAKRMPPDDLNPAVWRDAFDAKFFSYINVIDPVVKRMAKRGSGVIVSVIGVGGKVASSTHLAGGSANAALMLATAGLGATYAAKGVRVIGVSPSLTETDRVAAGVAADARLSGISVEEARRRGVAKLPLGRMAAA